MAWEKETWVDDDGSDTVGTPFSADRMNNIEDGIEEKANEGALETTEKGLEDEEVARLAGEDELNAKLEEANVTIGHATALAAAASAGAVGASGAAINALALAVSASAGAVGASGVALSAQALALSASAGAVAASGAALSASAAALGASAALVSEQFVRASGDALRPWSIDHDAVSFAAASAGNLQWTHTPGLHPAAILVLIGQDVTGNVGGSADQVNGVTYGGIQMQRIGEGRILARGAIYAYILAQSRIKIGPQTVKVEVKGSPAQKKTAMAVSLRAPQGETVGWAYASANSSGANALPWLEGPVWYERAVYGIIDSNQDPNGAGNGVYLQDELGESELASAAFINWARRRGFYEANGTSEPELLWSHSKSAQSVAMLVSIGLTKDWGELNALPLAKSCLVGDTCQLVVDATNNLTWDLVYDNKHSLYPWRVRNGAKLSKMNAAAFEGVVENYTKVSGSPEINLPVKGLYELEHGLQTQVTGGASSNSYVALYIGGVLNTETEGYCVAIDQFEGGSVVGGPVTVSVPAANTVVDQRVRGFSNAWAWNWSRRWIKATPLRVG